MEEYEINSSTCLLLAIGDNTKIIELDNEININNKTINILDYSCKYYGSSYLGRKAGSISILKNIYKVPIIVEESNNIIFFPISSPRYHNTSWISLKNIKSYKKSGKDTEITFLNNKKFLLNVSYLSFQNQLLRSSYLEIVLNNRKNN